MQKILSKSHLLVKKPRILVGQICPRHSNNVQDRKSKNALTARMCHKMQLREIHNLCSELVCYPYEDARQDDSVWTCFRVCMCEF